VQDEDVGTHGRQTGRFLSSKLTIVCYIA
jgi:hypothetical protein